MAHYFTDKSIGTRSQIHQLQNDIKHSTTLVSVLEVRKHLKLCLKVIVTQRCIRHTLFFYLIHAFKYNRVIFFQIKSVDLMFYWFTEQF